MNLIKFIDALDLDEAIDLHVHLVEKLGQPDNRPAVGRLTDAEFQARVDAWLKESPSLDVAIKLLKAGNFVEAIKDFRHAAGVPLPMAHQTIVRVRNNLRL